MSMDALVSINALVSIDSLIDTLVSDAQLANGTPAEWLMARGAAVRPTTGRAKKFPNWTTDEEAFYLEYAGAISLDEMAEALGRTVDAILAHAGKRGFPSPTRMPGYVTARQISMILGVDSHAVPTWVDRGILPGLKIPGMRYRAVRRVKIMDLKMWMVKPTSWLYFSAEMVKNDYLRKLVMRAQDRWGDQWWDTRQVANYHHVSPQYIKVMIRRGQLPAVQAPFMGGRRLDPHWSFWYVRMSDALKMRIRRMGDPSENWETKTWSSRADNFLTQARLDGKTYETIARMMKWPVSKVRYRANRLLGGKVQ